MKKIIISIISALLGAGVLTGVGFYVVPKFIQKQDTPYTEFIEKIGSWIGQNWIWLLVVAVSTIFLIVGLCLLIKYLKQNGKKAKLRRF